MGRLEFSLKIDHIWTTGKKSASKLVVFLRPPFEKPGVLSTTLKNSGASGQTRFGAAPPPSSRAPDLVSKKAGTVKIE